MSDTFLDAGIAIVLFLQALGSWLLLPMQLFSFLGTEEFYLLVAPAIYWCISARTGLRIGLYLSLSAGISSIMKLIFHSPRPYWYDRRVAALSTETSFGIPSGHSQNSVAVWGGLAASIGRRWAWAAAVVLSLAIGLSRGYLGVHFPWDVLAGWLIGALLLWIFLKYESRVLHWLSGHSLSIQVSLVFLASLILIAVMLAVRIALLGWEIPAEWIENAGLAAPGAEPIDPLAVSGLVSNAAVFFGFAAGGIWINANGGYSTRGAWWQLVLRYALGLVGVVVFWYGLGLITPDGESSIPLSLRYVRYALVGLWVSGLAPLLFIRLRLSHPAVPRNKGGR